MLNELVVVEQGMVKSGIAFCERHMDVKDVGRKPTLRVRLGPKGEVVDVDPVPNELRLWTFGKGKKQRFPFLQPSVPLMRIKDEVTKMKLENLRSLRADKRRNSFLELCREAVFDENSLVEWPGARDKNGEWSQNRNDYLEGLKKRRNQIQCLKGTDGESVLAVIDRFLAGCHATHGGLALLRQIVSKFLETLQCAAGDDWLRVGEPLLLFGGGALFFDVPSAEFSRLVGDPRQVCAISQALKTADLGNDLTGRCALSGEDRVGLVKDTFPELVLPVIGNTILFSRFDAIPSNARYGRFGAKSFLAGRNFAERLAGALRWVSSPEQRGNTWKSLPSEIPKRSDLLIAFVHEVTGAPVAYLLTDDIDDFSEEQSETASSRAESVAAFEERTRRLFEAVMARVSVNWRNTPVSIAIFRKVDQANRKVIYSCASDAKTIYDAAISWIAGERNIPETICLWIMDKDDHDPRPIKSPHVAPLALTKISKQIFLRNGKRPSGKRKEETGLVAAEALGLFLDGAREGDRLAEQRARRILHLLLARRTALVTELSHSQRRRRDSSLIYDSYEALRTVTLIGVLLHKLNREKEVFMNETAFRLGQLLAVVDVVHAGYCADVRSGGTPPSLLGNQVFVMAQTAPAKALATLCRRWKPYAGWARKNNSYRMPERFTNGEQWKNRSELKTETERAEFDKEAAIVTAISQSRKVASITAKLTGHLPSQCDDVFRAELLLGYMTGIPRNQRNEDDIQDPNTSKEV